MQSVQQFEAERPCFQIFGAITLITFCFCCWVLIVLICLNCRCGYLGKPVQIPAQNALTAIKENLPRKSEATGRG